MVNEWIDSQEVAPPIDEKFTGWHESRGIIYCGAYVGHGWHDEDIKENMRLKRVTHWMVIEPPKTK